jgi:choline dehydrogenase-like flavoprotein
MIIFLVRRCTTSLSSVVDISTSCSHKTYVDTGSVAGPTGACLAANLAKTKRAPKVLLLEAGPEDERENPNILAERFSAFMQYPSEYFYILSNCCGADWPKGLKYDYKSVPQKHVDNRVLDYPREKGLGGTSLINFMAYTVGPRDDYERWAKEVGDPAFNWDNSMRLRKKIEIYQHELSNEVGRYARPDMKAHGECGPVKIGYPKSISPPMALQLDVAEESGLGFSLDINSGNPLGLSCCPATTHNDRRVTAASAYLSGVPSNLTVQSKSLTSKVIFEGRKAVGVMVNDVESE